MSRAAISSKLPFACRFAGSPRPGRNHWRIFRLAKDHIGIARSQWLHAGLVRASTYRHQGRSANPGKHKRRACPPCWDATGVMLTSAMGEKLTLASLRWFSRQQVVQHGARTSADRTPVISHEGQVTGPGLDVFDSGTFGSGAN